MRNIKLNRPKMLYSSFWCVKILWRTIVLKKLVVCSDIPHWVLLCIRYKLCDKNLRPEVTDDEWSTMSRIRKYTDAECRIRRLGKHRHKPGILLA